MKGKPEFYCKYTCVTCVINISVLLFWKEKIMVFIFSTSLILVEALAHGGIFTRYPFERIHHVYMYHHLNNITIIIIVLIILMVKLSRYT